ncbi:MAG: hypothetical protein LBR17_09465 [Bacteroidales bacterium]|jgi:hypothetical protein|nr:hypothetical protein [Bacteroidales bacterium]
MKQTTFNWAKARGIMSKTLCYVMIATAIVSFSSCSDDDDDNNNGGGTTGQFTSLQVNLANGSQYTDIATVVAGDLYEPYSNVANYNNGNFTLQMLTPATEDLYLFAEYAPSEVTFSDANVKVAMFDDIACYDANADQIADISYHSSHGEVTFIYADRDCNITGTYSEEDYINNCNLQLKKGWNKMYMFANADETVMTVTTTAQSGFQWDIDYWNTDTEKTSAQRPETKGFWKF